MTTTYIGRQTSRLDGREKVTGAAKYAADYTAPSLAYGYVVSSTIAKGKITSIDTSAALALPRVLQVFTHENISGVAQSAPSYRDDVAPPGSPFRPLSSDAVLYSGQPIALVVAEEFEIARHAARLIRVTYETEVHTTDLSAKRGEAYEPPEKRGDMGPSKPRGDAESAYANDAIRHEADYIQPIEHHNPME